VKVAGVAAWRGSVVLNFGKGADSPETSRSPSRTQLETSQSQEALIALLATAEFLRRGWTLSSPPSISSILEEAIGHQLMGCAQMGMRVKSCSRGYRNHRDSLIRAGHLR
jgi:hypothetical protein